MIHTHLAFVGVIAASLVACNKTPSSDKAEKSTESRSKEEAKPAKKPVTVELFGKQVAPPGALAKLTWGSTQAEAKAAAPTLFPKPADDFQLVSDPELDHVSYGVGIDKETKKLSRMYIQLAAKDAALVAKAWGPGKDAKDSIGRPRTYWFDPDAGWRAYLEKGFGDDQNLEFYRYLPAAKLLGDGADTFGFAPDGILGASIADLRTRFPKTLVETSSAKAAEEQKRLGAFVGKDLDKEIGKAKPSVRIDLPPTEWEQFWTRVQITWGDDGKVESFWFGLPYEAYKPAKDEIRALLDTKWGAPKEAKEYGKTGDPIWIYRDKDPRVVLKDDTISHKWDVRVSAKQDN